LKNGWLVSLSLILVLAFAFEIHAQWQKSSSVFNGRIKCIEDCEEFVLAGSSRGSIYKSFDGGESWSNSDSGLESISNEIVEIKKIGSKIYASIEYQGLFQSEDQGSSWIKIDGEFPETFEPESFDGDESCLFIATGEGVFRSLDTGNSWNAVNEGLTDLDVRALKIIGDNIFVGTYSEGIFKSSKDEINWVSVSNELVQSDVVRCFIASPGNSEMIFAGSGSGVYYSEDGGDTWNPRNDGIERDIISEISFRYNDMYATLSSGDGGVVASYDLGMTWQLINDGFPEYPYVSVISNHNSNLIVFISKDSSVYYRPVNQVTPIEEQGKQFPNKHLLFQNFPNPFKSSTNIVFSLPNDGKSITANKIFKVHTDKVIIKSTKFWIP